MEQKEGSLQEKKVDDPLHFLGSETGLNLNEKKNLRKVLLGIKGY